MRLSPNGFFAGLLRTNFYRQALAAFFPAGVQHFRAVFGAHTLTESVSFRALFFARLPRAFHEKYSNPI